MSTRTPSEARGPRLGRLRLSDPAGFSTPIWQALVTGLIFAAVGLAGFHAPRPHGVAVALTGPPAATRPLAHILAHAPPGAFTVRAGTDRGALDDLRHGRIEAVVKLGGREPALLYAGANGPTATNILTHIIPAIAAHVGITLTPRDVLPLGPDDTAGLPLFYMTFAVILASYLFAVTSGALGTRLRPREHWLAAVILAGSLGIGGALIARYGTHTLDGGSMLSSAGLLALASLATSSGSFLLIATSRLFGGLIASVLFVILGSASGGVVPSPYLPPWLAFFRPILPMGASLSGIRDTVYFHSHAAGTEALVLLLWALLPIAIYQAGIRLRRNRGGAETEAPRAT